MRAAATNTRLNQYHTRAATTTSRRQFLPIAHGFPIPTAILLGLLIAPSQRSVLVRADYRTTSSQASMTRELDPEGFDPVADTVGPGIYSGKVKRDEDGNIVFGRQYQNHNPVPGPVYGTCGTPSATTPTSCAGTRTKAHTGAQGFAFLPSIHAHILRQCTAGRVCNACCL